MPFFVSLAKAARRLFQFHWRPTYAQYGEDVIAAAYLAGTHAGFYVDVGAHHPKRFSNTYLLYLRGWRGINIDAIPGSMKAFDSSRPRDTNLELGIGEIEGKMPFFMFDEPAVSTFDAAAAQETLREGKYRALPQVAVEVHRLESVLERWLPDGQEVHLLSVDVEGWEMPVLRSNNWQKYRPRVILVELNNVDCYEAGSAEVTSFLVSSGYRYMAKTYNTLAFVRAGSSAPPQSNEFAVTAAQ